MPAKTIAELREMQRTMWRLIQRTPRSYGRMDEIGPKLSRQEVEDVLAAIPEHGLVCELTSVAFGFGQIGLTLYLDERFPGTGPEYLFCLSENHLDPKDFPWVETATGGDVHPEAWELFRAGWQPENVARLKALGLKVHTQGSLSY